MGVKKILHLVVISIKCSYSPTVMFPMTPSLRVTIRVILTGPSSSVDSL